MQPLLEKDSSALKTILNLASKILPDKNEKKKDSAENTAYLNGSIAEYTKDLIMTFPMMCDNSLPATTASMISRASERNIVTMLELMFASVQLNGTNGAEILSRLHKNISTSMSMDDVIDTLDDIANTGGQFNESVQVREAAKMMSQILKTPQKSYPVNSFSEKSLNEYTVYNIYGKTVVREDATTKEEREEERKEAKEIRDAEASARAKRESELKTQDMGMGMLNKVLLDQDVKKANELTPTLMIVRYNEMDNDGTIYAKSSFVTGVKSRLVSVDSMDIIERLAAKNKSKLSFLNLIRATTGEIRFISDFLLCIDQAKIESKNSVKKGPAAKMWKVLEARSAKNSKNKLKKAGNDASAITTLVINQETANLLKKQYDFDIENVKNAKMILEAYNLLSIIICDESIEVAKFLYAGNDSYEPQAYSFLEREGKDSSYKKVINLLNTNGR